MTFNVQERCTQEIKANDPNFMMPDGVMLVPRAVLRISNKCPENIRALIQQAMQYGWIQASANVYNKELMWEKLNEVA